MDNGGQTIHREIIHQMKEYFQHDFNSRNDRKLVKLAMRHGMAGVGVYWCIVEMMYEESGRIMLSECERIAFELRVQCDLVESVVHDFDLFICDEIAFVSESVNRRIQQQINVSNGAKKASQTRWEKFKNQQLEQPDANAMRTHEKRNANKEKKRKEKESKLVGIDSVPESPQIEKVVDLKIDFFEKVSQYREKYSEQMLANFANYWSEKNQKGKMKWQLEKTFEIPNRLATWHRNDSKFSNPTSGSQGQSKMDIRMANYQQSVNIINELFDEQPTNN
jgi:hypothetical protein